MTMKKKSRLKERVKCSFFRTLVSVHPLLWVTILYTFQRSLSSFLTHFGHSPLLLCHQNNTFIYVVIGKRAYKNTNMKYIFSHAFNFIHILHCLFSFIGWLKRCYLTWKESICNKKLSLKKKLSRKKWFYFWYLNVSIFISKIKQFLVWLKFHMIIFIISLSKFHFTVLYCTLIDRP